MSLKLYSLRVLTAFLAAVTTAMPGSSSSQSLSDANQNLSKLTIEERLTKVREKARIRERQMQKDAHPDLSLYAKDKSKHRNLSQAKWENWNNWSDWNDWSDWRDETPPQTPGRRQPGH